MVALSSVMNRDRTLAALMQAFSAAGQEMYQSQAAEAEAAGDSEAGFDDQTADVADDGDAAADADEDVVEADYEIVEEEK